MQRIYYHSDMQDRGMEYTLVELLIDKRFHVRVTREAGLGTKIFAVKPDGTDSATEVDAVLNDCG